MHYIAHNVFRTKGLSNFSLKSKNEYLFIKKLTKLTKFSYIGNIWILNSHRWILSLNIVKCIILFTKTPKKMRGMIKAKNGRKGSSKGIKMYKIWEAKESSMKKFQKCPFFATKFAIPKISIDPPMDFWSDQIIYIFEISKFNIQIIYSFFYLRELVPCNIPIW